MNLSDVAIELDLSCIACQWLHSVRGSRSKGKGKGIRARDRARGRRGIWAQKMEKTIASLQAFLSFLPRASKFPLPLPISLSTSATQANDCTSLISNAFILIHRHLLPLFWKHPCDSNEYWSILNRATGLQSWKRACRVFLLDVYFLFYYHIIFFSSTALLRFANP